MTDVVRHKYRELSDLEKIRMKEIKDMGAEFLYYLRDLDTVPLGSSRELAIAKTKIEEAVMWAVKHITA